MARRDGAHHKAPWMSGLTSWSRTVTHATPRQSTRATRSWTGCVREIWGCGTLVPALRLVDVFAFSSRLQLFVVVVVGREGLLPVGAFVQRSGLQHGSRVDVEIGGDAPEVALFEPEIWDDGQTGDLLVSDEKRVAEGDSPWWSGMR